MFHVTYEIVTPASAECGEAYEAGFVQPGGMKTDDPGEGMTLREALQLASPYEDCGRWWQEIDGSDDYRTGANEVRAIHPPANITAASYHRISRLLLGGCHA